MEEIKLKPISTKANGAQVVTATCAVIATITLIADLLIKVGVIAMVAEKSKPYLSALSSMVSPFLNIGGNSEEQRS